MDALSSHGQGGVLVAQHLDPGPAQRQANLLGPGPVVVVAKHGEHGRGKAPHHVCQLVQIELAMADKVSRHQDHVRILGIDQGLRLALKSDGGDPPDVQIGEVRDTHGRHLPRVGLRTRELSKGDSPALPIGNHL